MILIRSLFSQNCMPTLENGAKRLPKQRHCGQHCHDPRRSADFLKCECFQRYNVFVPVATARSEGGVMKAREESIGRAQLAHYKTSSASYTLGI